MVNVSKKYLEKELKNRIWGDLSKQIKKTKSISDFENVLARQLTSKELIMLEKRLAIDFLLHAGVRHNEIKRIIDVSSHTITSVKRKLRN